MFSYSVDGSSHANGPNGANGTRIEEGESTKPVTFFISLFVVTLNAVRLISAFRACTLGLTRLGNLGHRRTSLVTRGRRLRGSVGH